MLSSLLRHVSARSPASRLHLCRMSAATTGTTVPSLPPSAADSEALAAQLLEEAAGHLVGANGGDDDLNWDRSMAAIKRTEKYLPSKKGTAEEMLKIRKACASSLLVIKAKSGTGT